MNWIPYLFSLFLIFLRKIVYVPSVIYFVTVPKPRKRRRIVVVDGQRIILSLYYEWIHFFKENGGLVYKSWD